MPTRLTIIGAGPGGYVAAIRAAQSGAQVTVVEDSEVGGVCLNRGCIPTKTTIASAEALNLVRRAEEFGVEVPGTAAYNLAGIRKRTEEVVGLQVRGIRSLFKSWGVSLVEGRGSLLSSTSVRVVRKDGLELDIPTDRVIIATGSSPARLSGFPFDGESVITSDEAVQLQAVPRSLLIVGCGYIGCEFAFIYRTLGAEVSIVEMMPRLLSSEDEDMAAVIEREFRKTGIKLRTNVRIEKVERGAEGMYTAKLSDGKEAAAEMVLVSVGRTMNSAGIGLEEAGVKTGQRGEIVVNERMETTVPGVYAVGDVTGKIMLAHVASRQGIVAVENALGGSTTMDYSAVPSGIFTMPEIGSVGLREHQAREQGIRYSVGKFPYRSLGKSHVMGETTGMVKVIADSASDRVLGVHICGAHATDLIHEGVLAVQSGTTARELGRTINAHPTLAETIGEASEAVHGRAIHKLKA